MPHALVPHALVPLVRSLLAAAALPGLAAAAQAATAHNSQAGAYGPTKHVCAPTPYFPAGGCASDAILDDSRDAFGVPPSRARPGRRLTYPGMPADADDE